MSRRTEARYDKFRKSISPQTSRPFGSSLAGGPKMEVNAIFVFFDDTKKKDIHWHSHCVVDRPGHQKSAASEGSVGVAFFSAALLTKNIPRLSRVSLLSGEIYDRHRESREAPAIIRSSWMHDWRLARLRDSQDATKKIGNALSTLW